MRDINFYIDQLTQYAVAYAPKLLLALVVLLIGWWIINRFTHFVRANLQKRLKTEDSIQSFLSSVAGVGLKVLLLISVAGIVGVETASFVGIIAALSFAIGLALQGNLSNFAAGLMILLMKPFKVGDEVKIQGFWAYVKEIQLSLIHI